MGNAVHFHGTVLDNGTVRLKGQIANDAGDLLTIAGTTSATYTIYLLDEREANTRTAVTGHSAVALTVADVILDSPGTWSVDATGYNFMHTIDVSTSPAFTIAGRKYLVEVTVTPTGEQARVGGWMLKVL